MRNPQFDLTPARPPALSAMLLAALALLVFAGCGDRSAARSDAAKKDAAQDQNKQQDKDEKSKKEKEDEAKKEPFEMKRALARPHEIRGDEPPAVSLKLGHWTTLGYETRSNLEDFSGHLTVEITDSQNRTFRLNQSPFYLRVTRPVVLSKNQPRRLTSPMMVPLEGARLMMTARLTARGSGQTMLEHTDLLNSMPKHQYNFVVLANDPEQYRFLAESDVVKGLSRDGTNFNDAHYRTQFMRSRGALPLPDFPLDWTSTAFLLWDDVDPNLFTADQQRALTDWLHWGGQLAVSGPGSLVALRGSFLDDYLPVDAGESRTLDKAALAPLVKEFGHDSDRPFPVTRPWSGVQLTPRKGANSLVGDAAGEPIVLERRVGRGRIVVTGFHLGQLELRDWPGFTTFINACLLRRAPRKLEIDHNDGTVLNAVWTKKGSNFDPNLNTHLRYFTRDADGNDVFTADLLESWHQARNERDQEMLQTQLNRADQFGEEGRFGDDRDLMPGGGAASWDDLSAATEMSRDVLQEAAGVTPPDADFVIRMLAIYLVVLVPVNWIIFKTLGRVEWAWVAAPVISVVFAGFVVRMAQLDVGFARARTEVAILETQPRYSRAHLTRYTALYSSLSTTYDLTFSEPGAVALPCATRRERTARVSLTPIVLQRTRELDPSSSENTPSEVRLSGFNVASNSTGLVHSEQFLELKGGLFAEKIADKRFRVRNDSEFDLLGACLMNRGNGVWIGALAAGETRDFDLGALPPKNQRSQSALFWAEEISDSFAASDHRIDLGGLYRLAQTKIDMHEICLLGWTDADVPGLTVTPKVDQRNNATFIVAHMGYGHGDPPQRDVIRHVATRNFDDDSGVPSQVPSSPPLPTQVPATP